MRLVNVPFEYAFYKHYAIVFVLQYDVMFLLLFGGLFRGEHVAIALFCYCYQLLFQPRTPLLQSKPPPSFQTVNKNQGLCQASKLIFSPRSNSATRSIILGVNLVQQGAENKFIMKVSLKLKEQICS